MAWLSTKIDAALAWLWSVLLAFFNAALDAVKDLVVIILDQIFNAVIALFGLLSVPSFMASGQLNTLFSALPPTVIWLLSQTGIFEGFALIGAGVSFFLLRKIFTLGRW